MGVHEVFVMNGIEELKEVCEGIGQAFEEFKSHYDRRIKSTDEHTAELERKVNLLSVRGDSHALPDGFDPQQEFYQSMKSWYPQRDASAVDYGVYRKGFAKYMRRGIDALDLDERKAMTVGVDPEGGYLAPSELAREIIRVESDNSVIRDIARVLPAGAGDVEFPASLTRPAVGWVGETQSRTATETPLLGMKTFTSKELYCMPEATQKLVDDSVFDIEQFLGEEIGLAIAEEEDTQFVAGDGVLTPRGFTTYPTAAVADSAGTRPFGTIEHIATGVAGNWPATDAAIYDKLVDVVAALRPRYRGNAAWVMPTAAIARLRKMKDGQSNPIWQPGMAEGQPDRLLGYPVREAEQMPAVAANSYSVAFADWRRAYWVLDRHGIRILRDPYTSKPFIRFYTTKRVAGGVADSAAIKLLKFAAT